MRTYYVALGSWFVRQRLQFIDKSTHLWELVLHVLTWLRPFALFSVHLLYSVPENIFSCKLKAWPKCYIEALLITSWSSKSRNLLCCCFYIVSPFVFLAPVNFTFVTSLFGIEEGGWSENLKIDRKELLETFAQLLQFNSRMTIFTEEAMKPFIMYHRQGKENITHVIGTKITDLEYYPYYSRIKEIMGSREFQKDFPYADEPRGYSPEYDIITNSKFSLLGKAAQENYFHTPYLFWIDSIYPEESHFPKTCSWMPLRGFQDKISIIAPNSEVSSLTSVSDIYKHQNWAFTTGLLGGSANAIQQMYTLHKQVLLTEFLDKNHVDDDTVLITATYLNNPELFSIAIGTYGDAFKLFN